MSFALGRYHERHEGEPALCCGLPADLDDRRLAVRIERSYADIVRRALPAACEAFEAAPPPA
jgi:hypothetical protein